MQSGSSTGVLSGGAKNQRRHSKDRVRAPYLVTRPHTHHSCWTMKATHQTSMRHMSLIDCLTTLSPTALNIPMVVGRDGLQAHCCMEDRMKTMISLNTLMRHEMIGSTSHQVLQRRSSQERKSMNSDILLVLNVMHKY